MGASRCTGLVGAVGAITVVVIEMGDGEGKCRVRNAGEDLGVLVIIGN